MRVYPCCALLVAIAVGPLGCSESSDNAPPVSGSEAEVKAATAPTKAGGILHCGPYSQKNAFPGEMISLELRERTAAMPKKFHGTFTRVDKTESGEKKLDGSFVIKERTLKTSATASGKHRFPVITFFDAKGAKVDE